MAPMARPRAVGASALRREGPDKLCGRARYIDDVPLPGCLHGATFRSSVPRARLKRVVFDPSFDWSTFVTATADDIPGRNVVALIEDDQPLLAKDRIMHPMEPVALVAHADRRRAYEALSHISLELEPLTPVLSIEEALAARESIRGPDNVFKKFLVQKGDVEKGLREADVVVEGTYRVPHQEHAYIENNGMAAWFEEDGTLVALGSLQCPYYVHKALKAMFGLPDAKVRVIQSATGGGFGGKEEYPNMVAGHAALLALKARRPVKIVYDRHEDMAATTKRHPAVVRHRTGLTRDGRLLAQDIEVVMDGGAYVTLSPVVLSRGTIHASGPYECPNVRVDARVVATNTPPNGAFRGFGAPQTLFAAELHWERIAEALGADSLDLRRKNVLRKGSTTATGQILKESVGAPDVLERCARRSAYARTRRLHDRWNKDPRKPTWRGLGLALVHHGGGFTGSGEVYLASQAGVSLTRDGEVVVLAASTEIGQGTNTLFSQIAAEALGIPFDLVRVEIPDTAKVPNSGPTVASRTCMVVGGLVKRAALELKAELERSPGGVPPDRAGLRRAAKRLCGKAPAREFIVSYEPPPDIRWDDAAYKGDAYGVYSYAAAAVDVEIDKLTFEIAVRKVTTVQDIGTAVNPLLAEGQIIGGTLQGLGWALLELPVYKDGVMQNAQLTNYIIPTSLDAPPMEVELAPQPYSRGPFGAKGVGELPMDVPAPAVAAAVRHATGAWMTELPILPERLAAALSKTHDQAHRQ